MRRTSLQAICLLFLALLLSSVVSAQPPLFTDAFPKEEFAERRARVMKEIGNGVAILQGTTEYAGYVKFRQSNQFFYLTGVEVPRAILLIDGKAKSSTLFLLPQNERHVRSEGPVLVPGDKAAGITGIEQVLPRERFGDALSLVGQEGRIVYTPFRPEALGAATPRYTTNHAAASASDPWDGRQSREAAFIAKLRAVVPQVEVRNLDPILDEMRLFKSPREVALIREASRISGEAIIEGMRSAKVGMYEYELEAIGDFVFKRNNSQGNAYFSLIASGKNAHYPHYHASQSRLEDGQMVLWDWGPDYKYYSSDVTRMFPANGKFSSEQRELYTIYLRLYQALMTSIRPFATAAEIHEDAVKKMDDIVASYSFTNPKIKAAATRFIDGFRNGHRNRLGHWVGMEVHDVGVPFDVYKPGMVFTIEPAMRIPDDMVYIRCEDTLLITKTGYENLSEFVPIEIEDIEKVMAEEGFAEKLWNKDRATTSTDGQQ
jgi:Xaa-Pro aminopeptidase